MSATCKEPKLRFREFSGEWEEKKLGEIGNIITGTTPSTANAEYYNGDKLFVTPVDIKDNRHIHFTATTLTDLGFSKGRAIEKDSVCFVCIGSTIGKVAQVTKTAVTNQQINTIVPNQDNNSDFLYSLLFYKADKIKLLAGVQAVPQINKTAFSKLKFHFPPIKEQQKIASFLSAVDSRIEQLIKKEQLLREYKKGVMQKIFSGEIRFKDNDGSEFPEWEEKTIDETTNRYDNLRIPIASSERIEGSTPYYGANGIQSYVQGYTHDGEFILIAEDGANDLKNYPVHYVNGKIWVNNHAHVLQAKEGISNNLFLKYAIQNINFEPFLVGGGRAKLNANIMMKILFLLPSTLKEQTKIANFLSSIDKKIEQTTKELNLTKEFKKGLLQQMFV